MPNFEFELELKTTGLPVYQNSQSGGFCLSEPRTPIVSGLDEVGRGPLAGPVVVAAVHFDLTRRSPQEWMALLHGLDDSKKLSAAKRDHFYDLLRAETTYAIGAASAREIDDINILQATFVAFRRAVQKLPFTPDLCLIDGSYIAKDFPHRAQAIVKGDSKSMSIAAASVLAKVTRDRLMGKVGKKYPAYGFERHSGYGTAVHRSALISCGASPHHRHSFIGKILSS